MKSWRWWIVISVFACLIGDFNSDGASAETPPIIGGYQLDWQEYQGFVKRKCFPTRQEMSDAEIAQKLNLELPELVEVKAALDKKDANALEKALAGFIDWKLHPTQVAITGKPSPNAAKADVWLGDSIESGGIKYKLGEHLDWWGCWKIPDLEPFCGMGAWYGSMSEAYRSTGDVKYVRRLLSFIRSLYHDARPPAQRPEGWHYLGPFHPLSCAGRVSYIPDLYRNIGASSLVTDEDKVMFLKMMWEHDDFCYLLLVDHAEAHNFAVGVAQSLMDAGIRYPEFKDSSAWVKLAAQRYVDNMNLAILNDGASWERSAYHYAYANTYKNAYLKMRDAGAPLPPAFATGLERMYDWGMWMNAPTLEWPLFGHSSLTDLHSYMSDASELFPNRQDFLYSASEGAKGTPPSRVARVLPDSGFVAMRSDWTRDALQMVLRFNTAMEGAGGMHDIMSFSLWAFGEPWMTNPGNSVSYSEWEYDDWVMDTRSQNTIAINWRRHDLVDNAGRLESFASLPAEGHGFTYVAGVSNAYESQHAVHRRAVLFIRPSYWMMLDVIDFPYRLHALQWYPYDIQWLGHFQTKEISVNPTTKAVSTGVKGSNRLYAIPVEPNYIMLEQNKGPLVYREKRDKGGLGPEGRMVTPYISIRTKGYLERPVGIPVLLYPAKAGEKQPVVESMAVIEGKERVQSSVAMGCRVIHDGGDDVIAMAVSPLLRRYGEGASELTTDGESAYVRRSNGNVTELGMVNGLSLDFAGKNIIKAGPELSSVYVWYKGEQVEVSTRGRGVLTIATGNASKIVLNGEPNSATVKDGSCTLYAGNSAGIGLTKPSFSTRPQDICSAAGVVYGYGSKDPDKPELGYMGPNRSVVVNWTSSVPADATLEYRIAGEKTWMRSVNPELSTNHRILLSYIKAGVEYEIRITSVDASGRTGRIETRIPKSVTSKVRQ